MTIDETMRLVQVTSYYLALTETVVRNRRSPISHAIKYRFIDFNSYDHEAAMTDCLHLFTADFTMRLVMK